MTLLSPRAAIGPLRLIFWGAIVMIVDLSITTVTSDGTGFHFDILNDFFGMVLIVIGVYRLRAFSLTPRYNKLQEFCFLVALVACLEAVNEQFIYEIPPLLSFLFIVFALVKLAALVCFATAMILFSNSFLLHESEGRWRIVRGMFWFIYVLPLGLFYLAGIVAFTMNKSFHINLGPAGFLLVPVFLAPIVYCLYTIRKMAREIEATPPPSDGLLTEY